MLILWSPYGVCWKAVYGEVRRYSSKPSPTQYFAITLFTEAALLTYISMCRYALRVISENKVSCLWWGSNSRMVDNNSDMLSAAPYRTPIIYFMMFFFD